MKIAERRSQKHDEELWYDGLLTKLYSVPAGIKQQILLFENMDNNQEKMRGQRGRLRALAGICHVHESYF